MASEPCSLRQDFLGKDVRDQPHGPVSAQRHAVGGDDARRLLAAMLQRVQAEVSKLLRLRMGVDRYHAALVMKFVGRQHSALSL